MQVLGVRGFTCEAGVVGLDEPGRPGVRGVNRGNPRQTQLLHHPILQGAERALDAALRLRAVGTDDVDVQRRARPKRKFVSELPFLRSAQATRRSAPSLAPSNSPGSRIRC